MRACKYVVVCWEEKCLFSDSVFRSNAFGDLVIVIGLDKDFLLLSFAIATCKNILK